jgi:hypothetical protein
MGMPAKIGLKRDRALARTGCQFDGDATMYGANAFAICGEHGIVFVQRDCARESGKSRLIRVVSNAKRRSGGRCRNANLDCALCAW